MVQNQLSITFDDEDLTELSSDEEDTAPAELAPVSAPISTPAPTNRATASKISAPATPIRAKSTRATTQKATQDSRARSAKLPGGVPPLKPGRTVTFSTQMLNESLASGLLDLEADYQRGVVWNDTKMIGLIDSIFNNFYIPPIVFSVTQHADGSESRVCIDGKQRLTAIHRFFNGELYYWDRESDKRLYYKAAPGKRPKLLTEQMRRTFEHKQLTCFEYDSVTPEQEREIFQRVQLGMALGPADRLPAINGPYADLVRALRLQVENTEGFSQFKNESRGRDFQALAQIVYMIEEGVSKKTCDATTKYLEIFLAKKGIDTSRLQDKINSAMESFIGILQDPVLSESLLGRPLTSMEFVMAVYLVHLYRSSFSPQQLSQAIRQIRNHWISALAQKQFLKANTDAFVYMGNFVKQITKSKLLAWDTPLDHYPPTVSSTKRGDKAKVSLPTPVSKPSAKAAAKRKAEAVEADTDSDDDCVIIPTKTVKKTATSKKVAKPLALETDKSPASDFQAKIERHTTTASTAKTTIKKRKITRTAPVPLPAAFASQASAVLNQVATPSVKPSQRTQSNPSVSQANSRAPARASSTTSTSSASTSFLVTTANPPVSSSSNLQMAFRGFSTPSTSPYITPVVPNFSVDRASPMHDLSSISQAPGLSVDSNSRMAPLRRAQEAAERKRNSMNGITSSMQASSVLAANPDGASSSASVIKNPSKEAFKHIKFNKTHPSSAYSAAQPAVIGSYEVNVNVVPPRSRSPSTDPRLRPQIRTPGHSESRLPTPPQTGQSPQIPQEHLFANPTHTHEQMVLTNGQSRKSWQGLGLSGAEVG